jgi:hypothetical protein
MYSPFHKTEPEIKVNNRESHRLSAIARHEDCHLQEYSFGALFPQPSRQFFGLTLKNITTSSIE